MKRSLFSLFLLFLLLAMSGAADAQTTGTTFTAASCQQSAVNAMINGPTHTAVNGDTINIPAGSCTWTTGITVPSGIGISIIGSGTPNSSASTTGPSAPCSAGTVITDGTKGTLFSASPAYGSSLMRISCMQIAPQSGVMPYSPIVAIGTCASGGCPNIRIDNISFPSAWAVPGASLQDGMLMIMDNVFGVLDHNSISGSASQPIGLTEVNHSAWQGVGQFGDNSWAQPDTFGTNQELYLENNALNYAYGTDTDSGGVYQNTGGGRFVCRFNSILNVTTASACTNHGTESTGRPRGGRQMEAYNNTLTCSNTQQGCNSAFGIRSGPLLVFNNSVTANSGSWFNSYSSLGYFRRFAGFVPWNYCSGQGPYDTNDGTVYYTGTISSVSTSNGALAVTVSGNPGWTTNQWFSNGSPYSIVDTSVTVTFSGTSVGHPGYEIASGTSNSITDNGGYGADYWNGPPTFNAGDTVQILRATACIDQPARGQGSYISGLTPTPTGSVGNALDPVYEWGDTKTGSFNHAPVASNDASSIVNRDFYYESVNQSAQTSPTSPFDGSSGVGHGALANRPATCTTGVAYWATNQGSWNQSGSGGQGELFKCTAANTWTLGYTPYTYPHPLESGNSVAGGNPSPPPPTNLEGTIVD